MSIDKKVILDLLKVIGGDGHTLYDAADEIFRGIPKDILESVTRVHKSDGTGKGSIWRDGRVVEEMYAVYGLNLLWKLAREVGANLEKSQGLMGRGFQARALTEAIREKLGEEA
jgi:hypothetical protein